MDQILINDLYQIRKDCYKTVLGLYKKANAGHIGASLSCMEILIYLFFKKIGKSDRFILSKGHAAAALYTVLEKSGRITSNDLNSYYKDGTNFAAHPPCNNKIDSIPFGTGSLGHGLSLSAGFALSSKIKNDNKKVYCVISEGDCNEGSTWEAAMFSGQHHLNNLVVILDHNKLQGFGSCNDIINLDPIKEKWMSFNFEVVEADNGNDFASLNSAFDIIDKGLTDKPKCIIAHTTKGHGISYMENKFEWHYLPMNEDQYQQALLEVENLNA